VIYADGDEVIPHLSLHLPSNLNSIDYVKVVDMEQIGKRATCDQCLKALGICEPSHLNGKCASCVIFHSRCTNTGIARDREHDPGPILMVTELEAEATLASDCAVQRPSAAPDSSSIFPGNFGLQVIWAVKKDILKPRKVRKQARYVDCWKCEYLCTVAEENYWAPSEVIDLNLKLIFLMTMQPAYSPARHQILHDLKSKSDRVQRCRALEGGLNAGLTPELFDEEGSNNDEESDQEESEASSDQ